MIVLCDNAGAPAKVALADEALLSQYSIENGTKVVPPLVVLRDKWGNLVLPSPEHRFALTFSSMSRSFD
jgi:hypothetical protein